MIGDEVNLGSRLEGITKIYGVEILVTKALDRSLASWLKYKGSRDAFPIRVPSSDAFLIATAPRQVSEYTVADCTNPATGRSRFVFRQCDSVRVVGKSEPVAIYELCGEDPEVIALEDLEPEPEEPDGGVRGGFLSGNAVLTPSKLLPHIAPFEAALELYRAQKFEDASAEFQRIYEVRTRARAAPAANCRGRDNAPLLWSLFVLLDLPP